MKKYQVVEHVRTSSFHHPREKKTAYSTERCLNEWWSMGTLGNWHHVTFTFELCGRRFPSGSRISWFSCYLYVAFMAQDGSRYSMISQTNIAMVLHLLEPWRPRVISIAFTGDAPRPPRRWRRRAPQSMRPRAGTRKARSNTSVRLGVVIGLPQ